jgi:hypothetical protein
LSLDMASRRRHDGLHEQLDVILVWLQTYLVLIACRRPLRAASRVAPQAARRSASSE